MVKLRRLREDAELTVFQLAVLSGVSIRTIQRIESETYEPSRAKMVPLVRILNEKLGTKYTPEDMEVTFSTRLGGRPKKQKEE